MKLLNQRLQTKAMQEKSHKGHLITFEGGEGAGKTSLIQSLAQLLTEKGFSVVTTREPGGSPLGNQIRQWLLQTKGEAPVGHLAELLLFLAARAQHIEELIQPAIAAGQIVLCDRFNDSTIAYQGAARSLDEKLVKKFCQMVCGTLVPELTFFLDVNPEEGLLRSKKLHKPDAQSGALDRIESEGILFHRQVQEAFRKIANLEPLRVYTIDAHQSQEKVLKEAYRVIEELVLLPQSKGG